MLIDLDDALADLLEDLSDRHAAALGHVALSHHEGLHFVTGNRNVLQALARCEALDLLARTRYRQIDRQIHDGHSLRASVRARIRVVPALAVGERRIERRAGRLEFRAPLLDFDTSIRVQATTLLGEHVDDASVYLRAARAHLHRNMKGVPLACNMRRLGGGGSTIVPMFTHKAGEEGIVLAIADSDRKDVKAPLGSTASALRSERDRLHAANAGFIAADAHILPCHELENLLPGRLLSDALPRGCDRGVIASCERAAREGKLGRADFADVKALVGSEKLLEFVAAFLDTRSDRECADYLFAADPPAAVWRELGDELFAWGCAPRRRMMM